MISNDTRLEIKLNLLFVLDDVVKSRQYLNKHFQNSMSNYFLENYATLPVLKKRFNTQSGRQVRKEIFEKYSKLQEEKLIDRSSLKCFLTMRGFVQEHSQNGSLEDYRAFLAGLANSNGISNKITKPSQEWISLQWKRLFALMILHHSHHLDIQGVYELWAHTFGEKLVSKDRQRKTKKAEEGVKV